MSLFSSLQRYFVPAAGFFLYPQSQYGPPEARVYAFTNGTLIDEDFCQEMLRVGNFFVSISVEGFEEANDGRRGNGHFQKALDAMELMHSHRIPFGVSICYTSQNYKVVTSDDFLDLLISKGCVFAWYFHYMPVGINASTDLLLTPEQRTYMKDRVREIRGVTGGKELYCIDFQNDGEFAGGCVAGRCSSSTARASPSTATICAPAPCWKTRSCCRRWWPRAARTPPTSKLRKAPSTCAKSASPTPNAGSPPPRPSGQPPTPPPDSTSKQPGSFAEPGCFGFYSVSVWMRRRRCSVMPWRRVQSWWK